MIELKRVSSRSAQNAPGAIAVIGALVVLLAVLAVVALRSAASSGEGAFAAIERWLQDDSDTDTSETPDAVAPAADPVPDTATVASDTAASEAPPQGEVTIAESLEHCLPRLAAIAKDSRLLAVDLSASNVDFVQEWAAGDFVRLGCSWDGEQTWVHEYGRMVVPAMVGERSALPANLLDLASLTPDWFFARMRASAAIGGLVEVTRVEVAWMPGAGVLTRVHVLHNGVARQVLLDSSDRVVPEGTPFPQVQRLTEMTAEAAQRGYRDLRQTNWSVGVLDSLEQMRDVHFPRGQRLQALQFSRMAVLALVPGARAGGRSMRVMIDHYGERQEGEDRGDVPYACSKPFTFAEARAALDTALRARRQTLAEFEAIDFELAAVDCAEAGRRPAWRFSGG